MHLLDVPGMNLPSIEGLLLRRQPEYVIGVPSLLTNPQRDPDPLESRQVCIPRERVAFYEVL